MAAARSIAVPGTAEGVRRVADGFDAFAEEEGLPPAVVSTVQVVLDELLTNTVRHGYGPGATGVIEVGFDVGGGRLEVTITDDAAPFDPLAAPPPVLTGTVEERPIGGLGVHLVRQLMDEVRYAREGGRNRVILRKRVD